MAKAPLLNLGDALLQGAKEPSSAPAVPIMPTSEMPMVLTLDEMAPNPDNPRTTRNPKYDEIKESIRARGLDTVPKMTKNPDIRHRDAASLLRDVVQLIRLAGNTREQVEAVLCYIIYNGMTSESITPFLYELAGEIPEYKELIMGTIAQQLKEEGIQLGIQQGIEQGIEQARLVAQQKLLETAYALLDNGVSLDVVIKSTGLSRETLEQPRH